MSTARLVDTFLVLDAHNDSLILRQVRDDPMDLTDVNPVYQVDLPRLRKGGVDCLFCMVGDNNLHQSGILIDAAHEMCRVHAEDFRLCRTASEVRAAHTDGKIAIVLTIEGQRMFDERVEHLRNGHRLGVRVASITHGGGQRPELQYDASYFGVISPQERENLRQQSKGLTPFARESLAEMARLRIPVDVAHINDAAFWEVIEIAECPVCYTHGGCYALCPHSRGLTDEMMKALAEKGGTMGIAFYRAFIHQTNPSLDRLCDHFIHALEIMGPDHVGIGSDFDGTPGRLRPIPEDVSQLEVLFEALAKRDVDEEILRKIAGENFLRLLEA
jgi:membrane dipeptidase